MNHISRGRKRDLIWNIPSETYETSTRLSEIHGGIRSLYLSGVPLFTREILHAVGKQINTLGTSANKIYVTGINNELVDFDVETGRVLPAKKYPDSPLI
jgi:hypothetical protein